MSISLSRARGTLVNVTRSLFDLTDAERVLPDILAGFAPESLDAATVGLLQQALSRGMVRWLSRMGWTSRRSLDRRGNAINGRLWERIDPGIRQLDFSPFSFHLLTGLAWNRPVQNDQAWQSAAPGPQSAADRLLLIRLVEWSRRTVLQQAVIRQLPVGEQLICRLSDPAGLSDCGTGPDWDWYLGAGAWVGDVFQDSLAEAWFQGWLPRNDSQPEVLDPDARRQLGLEMIQQCESRQRFEQLRFLVWFLQRVDPILPVFIDQFRLRANAGADAGEQQVMLRRLLLAPQLVTRLQECTDRCRLTGFYDEGYEQAQFWLQFWEQHAGNHLYDKLSQIPHELRNLLSSEY